MPVTTGIQRERMPYALQNSWIPGRASYRQLARNDGAFLTLVPACS